MEKRRERLMRLLNQPAEGVELDDLDVEALEPVDVSPVLRARLVNAALAAGRSAPSVGTAAAVVPLAPRRRWPAVASLGAALAAAACAVLALRMPPRLAMSDIEVDLDIEKSHVLLGGGAPAADDDDEIRLGTRSWLNVVLKTTKPVDGELAVGAYLRRGDSFEPWESGRIVPIGGGRFEMHEMVRDLRGLKDGGEFELVFVLGRAGRLPSRAEAQAAADAERKGAPARSRDWKIIRRRVIIRPT